MHFEFQLFPQHGQTAGKTPTATQTLQSLTANKPFYSLRTGMGRASVFTAASNLRRYEKHLEKRKESSRFRCTKKMGINLSKMYQEGVSVYSGSVLDERRRRSSASCWSISPTFDEWRSAPGEKGEVITTHKPGGENKHTPQYFSANVHLGQYSQQWPRTGLER